jgi:hypothetical protein
VGRAIALQLVCAGWEVVSSGRAENRFPRDLREAGVRFVRSDRYAAEVSVLRPSRIHGVGGTRPREWVFAKRVLDGRRHLLLARGGRGINHQTAAVNLASLVEFCAARPETRILNCADPDAPDGLMISRLIAAHLAHTWNEVLLDATAPEDLGDHPWNTLAALCPGHVCGGAARIRPGGHVRGDGQGRSRVARRDSAVWRSRPGAAIATGPVLPVLLRLRPRGCMAGRPIQHLAVNVRI